MKTLSYQKLKKILKSQFKKLDLKERGSVAVAMSLIASAAIASSIYLSQDTINKFIAGQNTQVKSDDHLSKIIIKKGLALGAYMVSNSLILCKEEDWANRPNTLRCIRSPLHLGANNIFTKMGMQAEDTASGKLKLKFKLPPDLINHLSISSNYASHTKMDLSDITFTMSFDLVKDWRNKSIETLIGRIPDGVCREDPNNPPPNNANPLEQVAGYCYPYIYDDGNTEDRCRNKPPVINTDSPTDPKYNTIKYYKYVHDSTATPISNTICNLVEYNDNDTAIVLLKVETSINPKSSVLFVDKDNLNYQKAYAGIRRPLGQPIIEFTKTPACRMVCATGGSGISTNEECRGEFTYPTGNNIGRMQIKIHNAGPGTIYNLSLLRKDIRLKTNGDPDLDTNGNPIVQFSVIPNILKIGPDTDMLLPGEDILLDDTVDCNDQNLNIFKKITNNIVYRLPGTGRSSSTTQKTISHNINIHSQPFLQISYSPGSNISNPQGACMKTDLNSPTEVVPVPNTSCPEYDRYVANQVCTDLSTNTALPISDGKCYYPRIEPQRLRSFKISEPNTINSIVTETTTTKTTTTETIVHYIPPH